MGDQSTVVHGVCPHDCYDTCGLEVTARDGRVIKIRGDRTHPVTQGFLCFKVNHYVDRLYSSDRVLYPLRRVGPKGQGRFERVSWERALAEVGDRIKAIVSESGGAAVLPYSFAGNMGLLSKMSMDRRFFNALGAIQLDRTICTAAADAAQKWVYGMRLGPDPETLPQARLILLWGTNPAHTNVHELPLLDRAQDLGAEIWTIDPVATDTARRYRRHVAPIAGTDVALALCLGRELIDSGRYDQEFVATYTQGFDQYYRQAKLWTREATAQVTGISPGTIEVMADRLATVRPFLLRTGYGVQRHLFGAQAIWALSALAILTGSYRDVGGGHLVSNSDAFPLNWDKLTAQHLLAGRLPRRVNMLKLGEVLTRGDDPPIRALFVYNANPAVTAPDQSAVLRGLAREDLFTVVHEQMLTDTARWADFVFPAAMSTEILDLHTSYWHRYIQLNRPAAEPAGESVSNTEFFRRLAKAMGMNQPELAASDEELIADALDTPHPWIRGITLKTLKENPVQKVRLDAAVRPFIDSPGPWAKDRLRLEPLPAAAFTGSVEEAAAEYPLRLLSPSARQTIKSSFDNIASIQKALHPELFIHPQDLGRYGFSAGDRVLVQSVQGQTPMVLVESDRVPPGTVMSYAARWNDAGEGTNVNQVTSARLSDWGGGATFYSARVRLLAMPRAHDGIAGKTAVTAPQ